MAYAWETQKGNYTARLNIKTLGSPGGNSPATKQIKTNHATLTFVDVLSKEVALAETVTAKETAVSLSNAVGGADAYGLPWASNHAVKIKLGATQPRFVTPNLNGCAVFIGGALAGPVVIHANIAPAGVIEAKNPGYSDLAAFNKWVTEYKQPMWTDVYRTVLAQLTVNGDLPGESMVSLFPTDYLSDGVMHGCVWGTRGSGGWAIYVTEVGAANSKTRKIWPA